MKTFKDVYIKVDNESIANFINSVTDALEMPWQRAYENEESSKFLGEVAYCFKRDRDSKYPAAGLSIFNKNGNTWYVPNVVPLESGQLSYDEYNEIITDFFNKFLAPVAKVQQVDVEISSGELQEEDIVGLEAAILLKTFSSCANKSTGSSHPRDRERWLAFIVEVSKSNISVDTGDLRRLLEQQGWSEDFATDLIIEFEFGRDLIMYMGV